MRSTRGRKTTAAAGVALALVTAASAAVASSPSGSSGDALRTDDAAASPYVQMPATRLPYNGGDPYAEAVTTDGRRLLIAGDDSLRQLDITTSPARLLGSTGAVFGRAIALARGRSTAYVSQSPGIVVADISRNTPRQVRSINTPYDVNGMAVSPSGAYLYATYGSYTSPTGTLVYSLANPRQPKRIKDLDVGSAPFDLALGYGGKRVITVGLAGHATIYNTSNPKKPTIFRRDLSLPFSPNSVAATPNSRYAFAWSGEDNEFAKIDLLKGRVLRTKQVGYTDSGYFDDAAMTTDGLRLVLTREVVANNEIGVFVFRVKDLSKVVSYVQASDIRSLAISPAGPTRNRLYLGLSEDSFSNPEQPPRLIPLRPR